MCRAIFPCLSTPCKTTLGDRIDLTLLFVMESIQKVGSTSFRKERNGKQILDNLIERK